VYLVWCFVYWFIGSLVIGLIFNPDCYREVNWLTELPNTVRPILIKKGCTLRLSFLEHPLFRVINRYAMFKTKTSKRIYGDYENAKPPLISMLFPVKKLDSSEAK